MVLFILFSLFTFVNSFNYLIMNPIFGFSQVKFMTKIADILADNGHNVTLFQPFHLPMKNLEGLTKNKNVEVINYYPSNFEEMKSSEEMTLPFMWDMSFSPALTAIMLPTMLAKEWEKTATQVLQDAQLFAQLKNKKFDAVLAETFDISGMYLGNLLNVPLISTMSSVRFGNIEYYFGGGSLLGYVPAPGSKLGNHAGLLDRLNDIYVMICDNIFMSRLMDKQQKMCQNALGENTEIPHWKDLFSKSTLYLTNRNPYLDFAVPNGGNVIPVGGFTMDSGTEKMKKNKKLSDEYDKIMNERNHTVLISFGSVLRSHQMPGRFKYGVIEAMRILSDITFIWKYEKDDELKISKRLSSNVHLKKWVPQHAILADPRLSLFVTHGGLASTMEIAYSGTVALMIPIFGDQPYNAMMLSRHGGATTYDRYDLENGEKLAETIKEMIHNPKYRTKSEELSSVLNNQPIEPKQILLKNMEFAVKFPNLKARIPEINSAGINGYYYIDIILFLTFLAVFTLYMLFKMAALIWKKIELGLFSDKKFKAE